MYGILTLHEVYICIRVMRVGAHTAGVFESLEKLFIPLLPIFRYYFCVFTAVFLCVCVSLSWCWCWCWCRCTKPSSENVYMIRCCIIHPCMPPRSLARSLARFLFCLFFLWQIRRVTVLFVNLGLKEQTLLAAAVYDEAMKEMHEVTRWCDMNCSEKRPSFV